MSTGTMFLPSISSTDSPLCHWPCDVVSSSLTSPARQIYRNRSRPMEGQNTSASSSSSASSPASLHHHSLVEGHRFEEKSPDNHEEDRKPMAVAKCMSDHTSPSFEMRMTFSEDCDDDHRAFHSASALGILDGDHIGIGIIPHAPEFLLQSYQHFAVPPEYESFPGTQAEEEEVDGRQPKMHEGLQEAFFMGHQTNLQASYPNNDMKAVKVWRRSSRVKAAKVVRSRKSPAKYKSPRKSSSRHMSEEPGEIPLEITPTERELNSAVNRRQKESLQQWYGKLNELNQFRIAKGHCNVPQQYPPNPQLGIVSLLCVCALRVVVTIALIWIPRFDHSG